MISREAIKSTLVEAVRIDSFADVVEKGVYLLAALVAVGFIVFLAYFMGLKVFTFFILFFMFLVMAKGLFVVLIK